MSWLYRGLVRPILFRQDAERIHDVTLGLLGRSARSRLLCAVARACCGAARLPVEALGLRFPNPVGLAAGMDKEGCATRIWEALGFGFCELGGVTRHAQPGNPPPRVFRAVADRAIVNRMGFNNPGAERFAEHLRTWRDAGRWPAHPVGVNLGKSKVTPLKEAAADYAFTLRLLWPLADFFVVNVSSPNTPNLRELQDKDALREILERLRAVNEESAAGGKPKPILVKVAPDLSFLALDEIVALSEPCRIAGIVATNTTVARPDRTVAKLRRVYAETGGLSGEPLRQRSTEVIRHLYRQTRGSPPIVGVGGIFSAADAWEKVAAGAALLQVYTGLVFEGPTVARRIVAGLKRRLRGRGLSSLVEAVGIACES